MKRSRKKYETPTRPWDKERLGKEKEILKNFGLKTKKEIWRAEGVLRKYRRLGRQLAAQNDKEKEKELVKKLAKLGLLSESANLDDVLGLTLEQLLERRLQTVLFKKGLANTPKQARQFIVHGLVSIDGRKVIFPSYFVGKEDETKILLRNIELKKTKLETSSV